MFKVTRPSVIMALMKNLSLVAAFLSLAQIAFVIYFLVSYPTDNLPLFVFLLVVPAVNLSVVCHKTKK